MKPSLRAFVLATLPAVLAVPMWATAASGAVLTCGQTITQSTVLDNDLSGCTNNGIVVGADNITLDLNGHTVAGTSASGDQGGVVLVGRTGVTVRNGTVRNFDVGVVIEGGSNNTVEGINAFDNISFSGTTNRGGDGIAILSSRDNSILRNNTVNNGPFSGIGIYSDIDSAHPRSTGGVSSGNVVDGNVVQGNIQGRTPNNVVNNDNIGIRLEPGNTRNFILNNRVTGNGLDGITLFVRNTFTVVRSNIVTENGFYRQTARRGNGIGLQIGGANDNIVEYKHLHPERRQRHLDPQRITEERGPQQHRGVQRGAAAGLDELRPHLRPVGQQPQLRRQRLAGQPVRHRLPALRGRHALAAAQKSRADSSGIHPRAR